MAPLFYDVLNRAHYEINSTKSDVYLTFVENPMLEGDKPELGAGLIYLPESNLDIREENPNDSLLLELNIIKK